MFHRHIGRHRHPGPKGGRRFGPRRPLRFLIERLDLADAQAAAVAKILEDLKLERSQADLDRRRGQSALADHLAEATLDPTTLRQAADVRVSAAQREADATVAAVGALHQALTPEQRLALSTLLRAGPLTL